MTWARDRASFESAWAQCPRGDWLLAIAARLAVPREVVVRAAARCAREALEYVPDDERRPETALDAVEAWCGAPDDGPLRDAVAAAITPLEALADEATDGAVTTAAQAALAAASAIDDPGGAPTSAVAAVQAAALDAGDCAMMQAVRFMQARCADLVRGAIDSGVVSEAYRARAGA